MRLIGAAPLLACVLASALLAASCGGDDNAAGAPSAAGTVRIAPPSPSPTAIATSSPGSVEGAVARVTAVPDTGIVDGLVAPVDAWTGIVQAFGVEVAPGLVHGGVDFAVEEPSAPVFASCDGVVALLDESPQYGRHVLVKCDLEGWTVLYGHLGDAPVATNTRVYAGDTVIGLAAAGLFHFELRWDLVPVDPFLHVNLNRRPSFEITATPTSTPVPAATTTVPPVAFPTPPGSTPIDQPSATLPPSTSTPTRTATSTPTATPLLRPTATPVPPTSTPTRVPTRTPTPSPTPRPATPTPTPLPQAF
jgi:hypothetical protein